MLKKATRACLTLLGVCLVLVGVAIPFLVTFCIMAATGGESHHIGEAGVPISVGLLAWSEWTNDTGGLALADWSPRRLESATITRHRVGRATGFFTRFAFYQALYDYPDGSSEIWGARGPEPMISRRPYVMGTVVVLVLLGGCGLIYLGRTQVELTS